MDRAGFPMDVASECGTPLTPAFTPRVAADPFADVPAKPWPATVGRPPGAPKTLDTTLYDILRTTETRSS